MIRLLLFSAVAIAATSVSMAVPDGGGRLWYGSPAKGWNDALPVGNGSLGGMIFGGVPEERIQFNEQTLWTGDEIAVGAYQPFGDLHIQFPNMDAVTGYVRELDLRTAVQRTTFRSGGVKFTREVFSSHPDKVMVIRLTSDKSGSISSKLRLSDAHGAVTAASGDRMAFSGSLENGLAYRAQVCVLLDKGALNVSGSDLQIKGADSVTLLLAAATSFANSPEQKWRGGEPGPALARILGEASGKSFEELRTRHVADYRSLYSRLTLDLGAGREDLSTDKRLAAYQEKADPGLEALFYQYGRYLLISSSRPGGLPANLQGIWNQDMKPAWYSGYTTNINIQMNYWLAEPTNLSECHEPYFDWLRNLATVRKKNTQPAIATDRGWIAYNTNNPMGGNSTWGIHRPGSAWMSQHLWTHYEFTGDKEFLRNRTYPALKELVEYWQTYLVESADGKLITPTGWSPEHGPVTVKGKVVLKEGDRSPQPGASYDQQIVWDLLTNYIEACEDLGTDEECRGKAIATRARLLGPQVGKWGQIQEWMQDVDDPDDKHRHVSQLFAVHPGRQINPATTPEWAKAAVVSLDARGDAGTGWSKAWKINFWARLGNGDRAHKILGGLLLPVGGDNKAGGVYQNLLDAHPPFQIDGNFGATAGMTEMLLQSHVRENGIYLIDILPSLPGEWRDGRITGLRARGGFQVDLEWFGGKLAKATIHSAKGGKALVRVNGKTDPIELAPGSKQEFR